jgi:hypothetical protein
MTNCDNQDEELVLLIGDFHIPNFATHFPKKFQELLVTDKISHVLCTGKISGWLESTSRNNTINM